MIDVTDTPPPRSRSTCPHCDATPGGCRGLHFVGGRYCCEACKGDHDDAPATDTREGRTTQERTTTA